MHKLKRQHGGTLLGIIIGLVAGLGIAIVVALMISKSSAPLSNKQGRAEKVVDPTPTQAADPNKPLYGKQDATREAAKDFLKDSSPKPADTTTDQKAAVKDIGKPAAQDKTATDKQQKPDAKPEAKATADKQPKSDEKWTYYLQAGAYREQSDAENARAKLALLGFEARISEMPSQGNTLYRVRVGPFGQVDAMNRVRGKLSEGGVDAAVIRIPK